MRVTRWAVTVLTASLACAMVVTVPSVAEPDQPPEPVTAGAMPAPQTDGTVFAITIVGDTVYAGGRFDTARPYGEEPGGPGEVERHNLLAFDLHTGQLLDWSPEVDGTEFSSSNDELAAWCTGTGEDRWVCDSVFDIEAGPSGETLYVGGDFDRIDGQWRSRVAAFDTAGGNLQPFDPAADGRVRSVSATADTVYFGGDFGAVGGHERARLAAVDTGGELLEWSPRADREVWSVLAVPELNRVVLGGRFGTVNGADRQGMTAVDATEGSLVPWEAEVPGGGEAVTDIVTDGSGTAWLSAFDFGSGSVRFEGRMAADIATGKAHWWDGCYGDSFGAAVADGVLYSVSHAHDCAASGAVPEEGADFRYFRLLAQTADARGTAEHDHNHVEEGDPVPEVLPWFPNTDSGPSDSYFQQGTWAIDTDGRYVVVGGEFTGVNTHSRDSRPQQSLTRFGARGVDGAVDNGPQFPFRAPRLSRTFPILGSPVIRWDATWNAQNGEMTYQVMREGTDEPIHEVTVESRPWDRPEQRFVDRGARSGTYWIRVVDDDGQVLRSPSSTL
ncbi:hypothetical protein SAMN06265360_108125 [Haloechinothrix alba]|uniref:PQQ-like domain-containing protein n=1 Tax=Haloechinothrix alba TaxID=664784 RepID=A0A238X086_9PSEU|nr:hypothetical protein [Haloechinothrix alba]SNR52092.1 hypothetical protein SAMN06265360_108125 [Haloechinothrix alba]